MHRLHGALDVARSHREDDVAVTRLPRQETRALLHGGRPGDGHPRAHLGDRVHDELGQFAEALSDDRTLQVFLFSPYFSSEEKREGVTKIVSDADEHFVNFLELLAERHRMPAIFRIRRDFDALYAEERKLLPATITSAVELDKDTLKEIAKKIEDNTGRKVDLTTKVDPNVIGGLVMRVGNMVMDGSIRARLERLRKQEAKAA